MMIDLQSYVQRGQRRMRGLVVDSRVRTALAAGGYVLSGVLLSAASIRSGLLPLVLALSCALGPGWASILTALGGAGGYLLFWGTAGSLGLLYCIAGLLGAAVCAGGQGFWKRPAMLPALSGMLAAVAGTVHCFWLGESPALGMYLLRLVLAGGGTWVFAGAMERRDAAAEWLAGALAVLALAQVRLTKWMDLGYLAGGFLASYGAFPAAALAGLSLDLAQITRVPMTAALCLGYVFRLTPRVPKWMTAAFPAAAYLPVAAACGVVDWTPLPALLLGGVLAVWLPGPVPVNRRRGSTGVLQVRLEMASEVLRQTQCLLLEHRIPEVDTRALVHLAAERACGSCPCRKGCREREDLGKLSPQFLENPLPEQEKFPFSCRKTGRVYQELRRSREQLCLLRGAHARQGESRLACAQQYRFLAEYLQELSDELASPVKDARVRYEPEVAASTAGKEEANGDRCLWFAGTRGRYFVLLCDGMGTGLGAAEDAREAAGMLRRLLRAGFPAEHALKSLNSLCALLGRAGAVTVDLAELELDTGRATVYKWGAAASYVLREGMAEKIGTAGAPPGLSVEGSPEAAERLSLRRGETLVLLSDGAGGEEALRQAGEHGSGTLGEMADRIVAFGQETRTDDATAALIRLRPLTTATR